MANSAEPRRQPPRDWKAIGSFLDRTVPEFGETITSVMQTQAEGDTLHDGCLLAVKNNHLVTQYQYAGIAGARSGPP